MRFPGLLFREIANFVLPPRCPSCGVTVDDDHRFCLDCWTTLEFLGEPSCSSCGLPFAFARAADSRCMSCLTDPPSHDGVRAVVAYTEQSAALAIRLKYGSRLGIAELIARHMRRFVRSAPDSAMIIPVPLHRTRLWSRGFNQSVLIGRYLSRAQNIPMSTSIISRVRATPPLRAMSANERRKVVKDAFAFSNPTRIDVKSRTVYLVDDVYTSGATANACAALLKRAGAKRVIVLCWARVLPDDDLI